MPYKGDRRKKTRTHQPDGEDESKKVPRSFIFSRGKVSPAVEELVRNLRKVFSPYTADHLTVKKSNRMKDFINIAGPLGVSHLLIFTQSDIGTNLRIVRCPQGPTMTFRVKAYSLSKDIINFQKRPEDAQSGLRNSPLVVLNNFGDDEESGQLVSAMLQNMFPPLSVKTIKLSQCGRVCLWNYNEEEGTMDMRHFRIKASPVGLNRNVKRVLKGKRIPNLAKYKDISEYVDDPGYLTSDSEAEDDEDNRLILPQNYQGKGNRESQKSAIRLKELGPRLTLQLLKIQEGVDTGAVLFHRYVKRTKEEIDTLQDKKSKEHALKRKRKDEQEANIESKKAAKRLKKTQRKERWLARRKAIEDPEAAPQSMAPEKNDPD